MCYNLQMSPTIKNVLTCDEILDFVVQNTKRKLYRVVQKSGYPVYFWDNFGNSAPILTILSLLQAEIYGA